MASRYKGRGGKRGPGSGVNRGRKGNVRLGVSQSNSFPVQLARRYKAMRGRGVVRDSGSGGNTTYSVHGYGGSRGTTARARITTRRGR